MARKSRRMEQVAHLQNNGSKCTLPEIIVQEAPSSASLPFYKVGIYGRLSVKDLGIEDGDTMDTQISLLRDYVIQQPDMELTEVYIDNGWTGTNFQRPEFIHMMDDVKAGKINCIVVKDLSRLGRNYLEAGYYLQEVFPGYNLRFIAIYDGFDSLTSDPESMLIGTKNIVNDYYSKDISKKISATIDIKRSQGPHYLGIVPYGYIMSDGDDRKFVIDTTVAPFVRLLFDWVLEGHSFVDIARNLNDMNVPKDISRKRKASTHSRLSQGAALGASPYGYRRNENHDFEIDPDSSSAVIRIFDLALEGKRMADICRIMTEERYLTPLAYGNLYPERGNVRRAATIKADFWSADTVRNILHNPAYMGTLVSGKTRNIAPNSHIRVPTDQNDWYVTEEVFPPLVSKETFERVQELYPVKKRKTSTTSAKAPQEPICNTLYPRRTILLGHLKCGYCGKSMNINRYGSRCLCTHARYNIKELCSAKSHKISEIEAAILPLIKKRSSQILLYEKEMQEMYREKKQEVKNMSYRVALLEKELDKLLVQKQSNYETFIQGDIAISKFQMLDQSMRTQIKDKRQILQELKNQMEQCKTFTISTDLLRIAEAIADYPEAKALTEEMVDVLVNYIIVKNDTPYEIHWKYDEKGVPIDESKN